MAKRTIARKTPLAKPSSKRSVSLGKKPSGKMPGAQQDPKRRLGNFTSAGEAPRKGNRTTGINGPQKKTEAANRAKRAKKK